MFHKCMNGDPGQCLEYLTNENVETPSRWISKKGLITLTTRVLLIWVIFCTVLQVLRSFNSYCWVNKTLTLVKVKNAQICNWHRYLQTLRLLGDCQLIFELNIWLFTWLGKLYLEVQEINLNCFHIYFFFWLWSFAVARYKILRSNNLFVSVYLTESYCSNINLHCMKFMI